MNSMRLTIHRLPLVLPILACALGVIGFPWQDNTGFAEQPSVENAGTEKAESEQAEAPVPASQAEAGLRRALAAMATRQWSGGWANGWSLDGRVVWGEHNPIPHNWLTVQPPATPGIARVYLRAAQVLRDDGYLAHARLAQRALLAVQTPKGGFPHEAAPSGRRPRVGTFDDDTTTGALKFLIELWEFTGSPSDREEVLRVGEFLLESQYPDTGGWPQAYPPNPRGYNRYITFNDNAMANVIRALLQLDHLLDDPRYLEAARRGGECILRLQGPPGQDVWAQQHDPVTLLPASARAFEPAAYTAGETRGVCDVLIDLYLHTGEDRFLEPLPRVFAWYEANRLPNGKWARFYEPETRRPIYGDRDGKVYYRLEEISLERQQGYSWEGDYFPSAAHRAYERIQEIGREAYQTERQPARSVRPDRLAGRVQQLLDSQHPDGWWTERPGTRHRQAMVEADIPESAREVVWSRTFCRHAGLLLDYLEAQSRVEQTGNQTAN